MPTSCIQEVSNYSRLTWGVSTPTWHLHLPGCISGDGDRVAGHATYTTLFLSALTALFPVSRRQFQILTSFVSRSLQSCLELVREYNFRLSERTVISPFSRPTSRAKVENSFVILHYIVHIWLILFMLAVFADAVRWVMMRRCQQISVWLPTDSLWLWNNRLRRTTLCASADETFI